MPGADGLSCFQGPEFAALPEAHGHARDAYAFGKLAERLLTALSGQGEWRGTAASTGRVGPAHGLSRGARGLQTQPPARHPRGQI